MDHVVAMRIVERIRNLSRKPDRLGDRQLSLAIELVAQRLALDEGHGEPEPPADIARVEDAEDVRMLKACGELDLALEPFCAEGLRDLGVQDFQRDGSVVPEIVREVHDGKATASELALDAKAVLQSLGK
jgi:hypothetical protein